MDEGDLEADERALAEIVRLHPERDLTDEDAPVATKPSPPGYCHHLRVALDKTAHKVFCRTCDREVDAFDYLVQLSGSWERYARHRKEAERRSLAAEERLRELLRLERNARARLKKIDREAERAAPQKPWGAGSIF